ISARKMTKAERRTFFVFIVRRSRNESQTGTRRSPAGHVARRTSLRFRTTTRLYHFPNNASKLLLSNKPKWELRTAELEKMPIRYGSAHAAVGRPVHLGHQASDDISLKTPAAYPPRAFSQDDIMTSL